MATSVSSGGAMLRKEEENETEVRREDQENINKFARLNARLHEARAETTFLKVRQQDNASLVLSNSEFLSFFHSENTRGH